MWPCCIWWSRLSSSFQLNQSTPAALAECGVTLWYRPWLGTSTHIRGSAEMQPRAPTAALWVRVPVWAASPGCPPTSPAEAWPAQKLGDVAGGRGATWRVTACTVSREDGSALWLPALREGFWQGGCPGNSALGMWTEVLGGHSAHYLLFPRGGSGRPWAGSPLLPALWPLPSWPPGPPHPLPSPTSWAGRSYLACPHTGCLSSRVIWPQYTCQGYRHHAQAQVHVSCGLGFLRGHQSQGHAALQAVVRKCVAGSEAGS